MSGRRSPRGLSMSPAASRAVTLRELNSLPPIPRGSIYIPSDFSEAPFGRSSYFEDAIASLVAVVSLGAFLVWLLFL